MKKQLSILLALTLSAICVIPSCSDNTASTAATTASPVSDTEPETVNERMLIKENVPEVTFDGRKFRTLVRNADIWIDDLFAEDSGDVVDSAVAKRNAAIEERFDIEFVYTPSSNNDYEEDALPIVLAGDDAYELVLPHGRIGLIYARAHILTDWSRLTYVDLTKPWWSQKASDEFTIYGKLFFTTGSLSYQSLANCQAYYFNKDIFNDVGIDYPYASVRDGSWTFERMASIAKQTTKDLNGDSVIEYADDQIGYISYEWTGPVNVLFAQGGHICTKDETGEVVLDYYNDRNVNIFERYFELVDSDYGYVVTSAKAEVKDVITTFGDGRAALLEYTVGVIKNMRGYDADFGVLPSPKYDEAQENYLNVFGAGTHVFCIPITALDTDFVSTVLEAWAAEAYRYTIPAYYDVALSTKYSRDDESAEMLDIIMEGGVVDIIYFSNGISSFSNSGLSLLGGNHDFASYYRANSKSSERELKKLMEDFE